MTDRGIRFLDHRTSVLSHPTPSLNPCLVPELEHQERPERLAVVADAGPVLGDAAGDLFGAEDPLAGQTVGAEKAVEQGAERAAKPARDRDAKTLLGPIEDRRREPTRCRSLEQPVSSPPVRICKLRGATRRSPRPWASRKGARDLQPAGHARPIDFRQDVVGQVRVLVEGQRTGQAIGPRSQPLGAGQVLGLDVEPARRAIDEQAGNLPAPRTNPASVDEPGPTARPRREGTA